MPSCDPLPFSVGRICDKGNGVCVITLCFSYVEVSLSVFIVDFEEVSCHESHTQKKMKFANNLSELGSGLYSVKPPDENQAMAHTLTAALQVTQVGTRLLDHRNCEIINVSCSKPLSCVTL